PPRGEGRGAVTAMPLTGTAPEPTAGEVFGPDGSPRGEGGSRRYEPYAARPTGSPRRVALRWYRSASALAAPSASIRCGGRTTIRLAAAVVGGPCPTGDGDGEG